MPQGSDGKESHPVTMISFYDAQAYCGGEESDCRPRRVADRRSRSI